MPRIITMMTIAEIRDRLIAIRRRPEPTDYCRELDDVRDLLGELVEAIEKQWRFAVLRSPNDQRIILQRIDAILHLSASRERFR